LSVVGCRLSGHAARASSRRGAGLLDSSSQPPYASLVSNFSLVSEVCCAKRVVDARHFAGGRGCWVRRPVRRTESRRHASGIWICRSGYGVSFKPSDTSAAPDAFDSPES
jgi:hypothetical protein